MLLLDYTLQLQQNMCNGTEHVLGKNIVYIKGDYSSLLRFFFFSLPGGIKFNNELLDVCEQLGGELMP